MVEVVFWGMQKGFFCLIIYLNKFILEQLSAVWLRQLDEP